jgi:hypothetical protein
MEIFVAIALLCSVGGGNGKSYEETIEQMMQNKVKCQKQYIKCLENNRSMVAGRKEITKRSMRKCVLEQK